MFGLPPPRLIIPPGMPAPAPPAPIGIGIIRIPPVPAACPISAGLGMRAPPNPDIAELAICVGVDPSHEGGTDSAPISRALPSPDDVAAPRAPLPRPFIPATDAPANFGTSAEAKPAAAAPAVAGCADLFASDII